MISTKKILESKNIYNIQIQIFHMIRILNCLWDSFRTFNWTILIYASNNGFRKVVELLLKRKDIDISIKDIINQNH